MKNAGQQPNKIVEFITVLISAVLVGGAAVLSYLYIQGTWSIAALIAIAIITLAAWSVLRKKFHRT